MLQVCPNGRRTGPRIPVTPVRVAAAVRDAVAAGASDVHLHPRGADGAETLDAGAVAEVLEAVRSEVPGVPVGVTTGEWIGSVESRVKAIQRWVVLPDHASVNWHEDGADQIAEALWDRGIGIEAGIFSGTDAVAQFLASRLAGRVLRVLAEVTDTSPNAAGTAAGLLAELRPYGGPVLLHGEDGGAWPVLRLAADLGLDTRIGLEDTLLLPDGAAARDNAALVRSSLSAR